MIYEPYDLFIIKLLGLDEFCVGRSLLRLSWDERGIQFS